MAVENLPPGPSASVDFEEPTLNADPCNFSLSIKFPSFNFVLPNLSIDFPPDLSLYFNFELSCDLSKPINVSAGVGPGGGRVPAMDPDPDDYPNQ